MEAPTESDTDFSEAPRRLGRMRYDAKAHLLWLLGEPLFLMQLGLLQSRGIECSHRGLAYRELPSADPAQQSQALTRWQANRRKLGSVLPPRIAGLLLVPGATERALRTLTVEHAVSVGDAIAARLQAACRARLRNMHGDGPRLSEAEQKFLRRTLARLDPERAFFSGWLPKGVKAKAGDVAHLHATAAAAGSFLVGASAAGWPAVGVVARTQPFEVTPLRLSDERYVFHPHLQS